MDEINSTIMLGIGIYMLFLVLGNNLKLPTQIGSLPVLITCVLLIYVFFKLELKYTLMIEKGIGEGSTKVRIDSQKLKVNPRKELVRYIENVNYYNNIWRVAAIGASIISIVLQPFIKRELFIITWMTLFTIIYNIFHWKIHHMYDFVFKSLKDALKNTEDFQQELHI